MLKSKKYYAWSEIKLRPTVDKPGVGGTATALLTRPSVKPGDVVTLDNLGIKEDEFDKLVSEGVIRSAPYPKTGTWEPPKAAILRTHNEALKSIEENRYEDDEAEDDDNDDPNDPTE